MDVKYIKDQNNNNISPVTLEKGVIDDNGVTLTSKLGNCIQTPSGGTVGQVLKKTANGVEWGDASGGIANETDPVFTASPAHGITANDIATWNSAAILGEDDGEATSLDFDPQADTVWNKAQVLSSAQQQQARANIGAAGVNDIVGIPIVNHGTNDKGTSSASYSISPNTLHVWGEVDALYLSLTTGEVGYMQEYMIQFTSGTTAAVLNLPSSIKWINNITPSDIEASTTYQVSILNGIGVIGGAV